MKPLFGLTEPRQDALQTQLAESSARGAALEAQIQEFKDRETQLRSSNKVRVRLELPLVGEGAQHCSLDSP